MAGADHAGPRRGRTDDGRDAPREHGDGGRATGLRRVSPTGWPARRAPGRGRVRRHQRGRSSALGRRREGSPEPLGGSSATWTPSTSPTTPRRRRTCPRSPAPASSTKRAPNPRSSSSAATATGWRSPPTCWEAGRSARGTCSSSAATRWTSATTRMRRRCSTWGPTRSSRSLGGSATRARRVRAPRSRIRRGI